MGLKFVVSEAQTRSTQASQASGQAQQAAAALQQSIQAFLSAPLSSKAYDSAKNYFMVAYTPICQSIIMTGESLANAHKKFLSEYLATVNGSDLDEDQLLAEIDTYKALLDTIDDLIQDAKTHRTDLERRSMNAYQAMQKRQEKLEKFREYSSQSASFFSDYQSSQSELNNGLAQVQDCKAWNASTGTFDIARLDMTWAKPINERWKNREVAKAKQKEEAFNNNLKKLEGYTIYAWPYEDPVTGEVTVSWFIDKDGQRLDNSELQNFLEMYGKDLDSSYYQVVDWQKIQSLENAALRRGETYITGQKYEGLSKGTMQLNGYISTGYTFAQQSGLYDVAMIAGLSYVNTKVNSPSKKIDTNQNMGQDINAGKDVFNYTDKVNEHMGNPDRAVPAQTLKDAISGGTPMPDPRGSKATMYYSEIYINGKQYNFEVLYDQPTNTIYHFKYDRRPLGPLPAVPKK